MLRELVEMQIQSHFSDILGVWDGAQDAQHFASTPGYCNTGGPLAPETRWHGLSGVRVEGE